MFSSANIHSVWSAEWAHSGRCRLGEPRRSARVPRPAVTYSWLQFLPHGLASLTLRLLFHAEDSISWLAINQHSYLEGKGTFNWSFAVAFARSLMSNIVQVHYGKRPVQSAGHIPITRHLNSFCIQFLHQPPLFILNGRYLQQPPVQESLFHAHVSEECSARAPQLKKQNKYT